MNILFTVCGRAGSKGVKNKNLKEFCSVPLIYYSLGVIALYMEKLKAVDRADVALNTDSEALIEIALKQKALPIFVIRREASLGGDDVPKVAVIRDCLNRSEDAFGCKYDMVVDLDITSPLRTLKDLENLITKKAHRSDADVVFSVTPSRRNPYFNMVKEEGDFFVKAVKSEFTTRQQSPVFYDMNASLYAYSPYALRHKKESSFFNDKADVIIMRDTAVLDIDSEDDYELMQVIAKYLFENDDEFNRVKQKAAELLG